MTKQILKNTGWFVAGNCVAIGLGCTPFGLGAFLLGAAWVALFA